jgi:hypothetical protein
MSPSDDLFGIDMGQPSTSFASPATPVKAKGNPAATSQGSPSLVPSPIVGLVNSLREFRVTDKKEEDKKKGKKKMPPFQGGSGLQYYSKPSELKARLQLLLASKKAGNDSKLVNEAMEIIDLLLEKHQLSKTEHRQIFNFLRA